MVVALENVTPELVEWLMDPAAIDGPMLLEEVVHRPQWMASAACRDEPRELFFPGLGESTAPAKAICGRCPVRAECLALALADSELLGVWGGTSVRERKGVRREVKRPPRPRAVGLKPCGTAAAYYRHLKVGEPTCEPCRAAHAAAKRKAYGRSTTSCGVGAA
jgi:WhiB family transcriptional regulator, redox-sensing transcriptional regulator